MSLLKNILAEASKADEVGELVALFRTSQLPTLVVERDDDVRIYSRWIEQYLFGTYKIDVLAVNGKSNLLRLYERRNEFAGLPVVFVANRGIWSFSRIPEGYEDIICTQGYSIENDVYANLEGRTEKLLDPYLNNSEGRTEKLLGPPLKEINRHKSVQESIIRWLAFELEVIRQTPSESDLSLKDLVPNDNFEFEELISGLSLEDLVPKDHTKLDKSFCKARGFDGAGTRITEKISRKISRKYKHCLPGKLLFEMLDRFSTISLHALYNIALTDYETDYKSKQRGFIQRIKKKLDEQGFISSKGISPAPKRQNLVPSTFPGEYPKFDIEMSDTAISDHLSTARKDKYVNSLVNILKSSGQPTIVVSGGEGNVNIIDKLVKHHDVKAKTMRIHKRDTLLSVYERRNEFFHLPVAFVADQEMKLFTGNPERHTDIIWTQGYSLENDLYADADLEVLLEPHEVWRHQQVIKSTIDWFAFEVGEFLNGNPVKMDLPLREIVPEGEFELHQDLRPKTGIRQPLPERVQQIRDRYQLLLPGHFLFEVLARYLDIRGRDFNFKIASRSASRKLYDLALEMHDFQYHSRLYTLMQKIEDQLENEETLMPKKDSSISQRNQMSDPQNAKPTQFIGKSRVKVGDKVNATILKKGSSKVTVRLQTDYKEDIAFEQPYYPGKVGEEVKLRVIDTDDTGRVIEVVP